AIDVHLAHLAGAEPERRVCALAGHDLRRCAGAAGELSALAGLELHAVHLRADRNVLQRQRAALPDRSVGAGLDRIADPEPLRGEDVAPLAVGIQHEREVRAPVRVVLEPLDPAGDAVLVALEIDQPVVPLVTAADMARRDPALVVPAAALGLRRDQAFVRPALVQALFDHADDETLPGGRGFELAYGHVRHSAPRKSMSWPGASRTYAFFHPGRRPWRIPKRFAFDGIRLTVTFSTF